MRMTSRALGIVLLAGGSVAACLVPDVELIDHFPDAGGTSPGGTSGTAGTAAGKTGSGASNGSGATSTSGGSASDAGSPTDAGAPSAGASMGTGGSAGTAGGAGMAGSAGHGPIDWHFGDNGGCDTQDALFCDDFETASTSWPAGQMWQRPMVAGAPSGTHVMRTNLKLANTGFNKNGFNVSFWVRFAKGNVSFVSWPHSSAEIHFGVHDGAFRFQLGSSNDAVAPELVEHTLAAQPDQWTCVEIQNLLNDWQATVTVFGLDPVKLALVGGEPDPGIDQKILGSVPGGKLTVDTGEWSLGDVTTSIDIDDLRIVDAGKPSVCKDFLLANQ
jgi:hypothetical protein